MTNTLTKPESVADVFLNLFVACLAPLFLPAAGGDVRFARGAAIETMNACGIRSRADLLMVAPVVAFGLAALGSLSLSVADDIVPTMAFRLRDNAISASRPNEQCRHALMAPCLDTTSPVPPQDMFPDAATIAATVERARQQPVDAHGQPHLHVAPPFRVTPRTQPVQAAASHPARLPPTIAAT